MKNTVNSAGRLILYSFYVQKYTNRDFEQENYTCEFEGGAFSTQKTADFCVKRDAFLHFKAQYVKNAQKSYLKSLKILHKEKIYPTLLSKV